MTDIYDPYRCPRCGLRGGLTVQDGRGSWHVDCYAEDKKGSVGGLGMTVMEVLKPFRIQMQFIVAAPDLKAATGLCDQTFEYGERLGLLYAGGFVGEMPAEEVLDGSPLDDRIKASSIDELAIAIAPNSAPPVIPGELHHAAKRARRPLT